MSEDSESDSWDSERLSSILNSVSHIEKTESEVVSRSLLPELTVFPLSVKFPTTFPNVTLQQKLIVSNGGAEDEDVLVTLKGDPEFAVNVETMVIPGGETLSFIVSFAPKEVNLYNGTLIIEGRDSVVVSLAGHCIPSPLEIPPPQSELWTFPNVKTERSFSLRNKSLSLSLRVVLATTGSAFTVIPQEIEIPPASSSEITLAYRPGGDIGAFPALAIQCLQSGDSLSIPLKLGEKKRVVVLDFGATSVGSSVKRVLNFEEERAPPRLSYPFSCENGTRSSFVIVMCAKQADHFESQIDMGDLILKLIGKVVEPSYHLTVSPGFPADPLTIQNIWDDNLRLSLSAEPFELNTSTVELRRNEIRQVRLEPVNTVGKVPTTMTLVIKWEDELMEEVVDSYDIPIREHVSSQFLEEMDIDLDLSTSSDDLNVSHGYSKRNMTASSSLLLFPRVSSPCKSVDLTISSAESYSLKSPEWMEIQGDRRPGGRLELYVSSIPSSVVSGSLTARTSSSSLTIPVIAYRGCSRIVMDKSIEMTEVSATQYSATLSVQNTGGRLGFVVFTQPDENEFRVRVSPMAAVVPPNESISIKFVVFSPLKDSFSIPVVAHTGDEILRQMVDVVAPSDFFSTVFADVDVDDEISAFSTKIENCKPQELLSVFRKHLKTSQLALNSPEKVFTFKQVTVSPSQIEFFGKDPVKLSILNLSPMNLDFVVTPRSSGLAIAPLTGVAAPYGETAITVQMIRPETTSIEIQCGTEHFVIPVSQMIPGRFSVEARDDHLPVPQRESRKAMEFTRNGGFSVDVSALNFETCHFGTSLHKSFLLSNDEEIPMVVDISSSNPAVFICRRSMTIPARGEVSVEIEFRPDTFGLFEESLTIENDDNQLVLSLSGQTNEDSEVESPAQNELRFPGCQPGAIRRAKIRVANRNSRRAVMSLSLTPPFFCSYPEFEVDPQSYVLVPIRFTPMELGSFEGLLTIKSSTGSVTQIRLMGTCFE